MILVCISNNFEIEQDLNYRLNHNIEILNRSLSYCHIYASHILVLLTTITEDEDIYYFKFGIKTHILFWIAT